MNMTFEVASLPQVPPCPPCCPLLCAREGCPLQTALSRCLILWLPEGSTSGEPVSGVSFLSSLLTEDQAAVSLTGSSPPWRELALPLQGLPLVPDWPRYVNFWGLLTLLLSYLHYYYFWCGLFLQSLFNLLQYSSCFMSWCYGHEACGILAPLPWMELTAPVLETEASTTGLPGKSFRTFMNRIFYQINITFCFLLGPR